MGILKKKNTHRLGNGISLDYTRRNRGGGCYILHPTPPPKKKNSEFTITHDEHSLNSWFRSSLGRGNKYWHHLSPSIGSAPIHAFLCPWVEDSSCLGTRRQELQCTCEGGGHHDLCVRRLLLKALLCYSQLVDWWMRFVLPSPFFFPHGEKSDTINGRKALNDWNSSGSK